MCDGENVSRQAFTKSAANDEARFGMTSARLARRFRTVVSVESALTHSSCKKFRDFASASSSILSVLDQTDRRSPGPHIF